MHTAFLVTDSRYWLQAQQEIDENWTLIKVGGPAEPQDWIEWIVVRSSVGVYVFFFSDVPTEPGWIFKDRHRRSYDIS
jgi:hypothetical protein